MIDWIIKNKEFLFGGIGLLAIYPAWWLIRWLLRKKGRREPFVVNNAESESVGTLEYKLCPLPFDINNDIESRPPLQKEEAGKHYVGLKVRWHLIFQTAWKKEEGCVQVKLNDPKGRLLSVYCEVKLDEYPELKTAREGSRLWVNGEIERVRRFDIYLCNVSLEFD